MSAAEELKALVIGFFEDTAPSGHEAPVEIIAALPQIVAVVEAAEVYTGAQPGHHGNINAALAALDEALTKIVLTDEETKA